MEQRLGLYKDAAELLSDPYACLKAITVVKHIALLPKYMGRIKSGVKEYLDSESNLYSDELDGVLIAYDNIRRIQPVAKVFEELPHLHFDIMVDVIVFQPKVGSKLLGEVNKINFETSVGCLVHNCFNASIFKPRSVEAEAWEGSKLCVGDQFHFEVKKIFSNNRVLSMKGLLPQGRLTTLNQKSLEVETPSVSPDEEPSTLPVEHVEPSSGKKRKSKKKSKDSVEKSPVTSGKRKAAFSEADDEPTSEPSRKKHKRKHKEASTRCPVSSTPNCLAPPDMTCLESPLVRQKLINDQSLRLLASIGALGKASKRSQVTNNNTDQLQDMTPTSSINGPDLRSLGSNVILGQCEVHRPSISKEDTKKSKRNKLSLPQGDRTPLSKHTSSEPLSTMNIKREIFDLDSSHLLDGASETSEMARVTSAKRLCVDSLGGTFKSEFFHESSEAMKHSPSKHKKKKSRKSKDNTGHTRARNIDILHADEGASEMKSTQNLKKRFKETIYE